MPKPVRIIVGFPDGERASAWRIWFGPNDIYIGFRDLGGTRKASIHYPPDPTSPTLRYSGFTRDFASRLKNGFVPRAGRTHIEWDGAEIAPGFFVEFRFRVPRSELRMLNSDGASGATWIEPGPLGTTTEVAIVSGPLNHELNLEFTEKISNAQLVTNVALKNGRSVWIISYRIDGPTGDELIELRRTAIQSFAVHGMLPELQKTATSLTRLSLIFKADDGSAGEWELAADFLGGA